MQRLHSGEEQVRVRHQLRSIFLEKCGGVRLSFSDPLYNILHYAQRICGFKVEKDRAFLQWVGTEWGRRKDEGVWLDWVLSQINHNSNSFVDDVRFPNEFWALKKRGFTMVKICRDDLEDEMFRSHSSETACEEFDKEWDYIINNKGDIPHFHRVIDLTLRGKV